MAVGWRRVGNIHVKAKRNAAIRGVKRPRSIIPVVEDMEEDDTESEAESCCADHNDFIDFKEETDRRYFEKVVELYNSTCMKYNKCITVSKKIDCYIISTKNGVYVCGGRENYGCNKVVCGTCYSKEIMKGSGGGRRSARLRNGRKS